MKRRNLNGILSALLAVVLAFVMAACSAEPAAPAPEPEPAAQEVSTPEPAPEPETIPADSKLVGVSMPTRDRLRWVQDGENMRKQLEELGYEVDLQFADNDPSLQITQLENMVKNGARVLIVASVDGDALGTVLDRANEAGCEIIAYDRPIGSDAVSYYTTFDNFSVGAAKGQFIADRLDLANAGDQVYNIEFIDGSPDDGGCYVFYDGYMSVLRPYIDAGTLNVISGQIDFEDIATEGWSAEKAQERFENLLSTYYADKPLHAVMASNDSIAQGVAAALETSYKNDVYPILTGQDCDIVSVKNILDGKQTMSIFKDMRKLAAQAAEMADAIMQGRTVPTNAEFTTVDGRHTYPAFYCEPTAVTKDNIEETLIDSGYYTAEELGLEP